MYVTFHMLHNILNQSHGLNKALTQFEKEFTFILAGLRVWK